MIQKLKKVDGTSIVSRDEKLQDKIDNNIKYDIWKPHSSYTVGTEISTKIKYYDYLIQKNILIKKNTIQQ